MTYAVTISGNNISFSMAAVEYSVSLSQSGLQGLPGSDGAALVYEGAWGVGTAFTTDDLVTNDGSTWACIADHTSTADDEPGVGVNTATYWTLFVAKGVDGTNGTNGTNGTDGTGWTGGSYNVSTGVVTFTSDDGLGFSTSDLRGAAGADGTGWTGGSYNAATGVVTFASDDGLGFSTGDLRGADGAGSGTVTSIDITGGTGIDSSGGPVTSSGAITVALDSATQTSLGKADTALQPATIGVTVQGYTAVLAGTTASYTTAEETKLAGIEALADVTDTANVTAAGALMDSELTSLSGIKTLTVPASTTISTFGASLVDDADAATARTTLGLGTAATATIADYAPLAGNVTLTGGFDSDEEALGTITSGTVTPEVDASGKENFKSLTNNGAFTLAPPSTSSACCIRIHVINAASAGAITTTGFDKVFDPDTYATTNAKEYFFYIDHNATRDVLTIREIV